MAGATARGGIFRPHTPRPARHYGRLFVDGRIIYMIQSDFRGRYFAPPAITPMGDAHGVVLKESILVLKSRHEKAFYAVGIKASAP